MKEDNIAVKEITYFHESAIQEFKRTDLYRKYKFEDKKFLKKLEHIEKNQHILALYQKEKFKELNEDIQQILKLIQPKEKKYIPKKPLRQPASIKHLNLLILFKDKYPGKKVFRVRFLVSCLILTFTGMRISECGQLTKKDIDHLIKNQYIEVFRPKTKDFHNYLCTPESLKYFQKLNTEINLIFQDSDKLNGGYNTNAYTKFMNN